MKNEIDVSEFFFQIIEIIKHKIIYIIIIYALFIIGAFSLFLIGKPTYSNEAVIYSTTNVKSVDLIIQSLEYQIQKGNTDHLMKIMKINKDAQMSLISISGTKEADNVISISIQTNSLDHLSSIEDGILYYFNNNKFVNKLNALRVKRFQETLSYIDIQLIKIDSIIASSPQKDDIGEMLETSLIFKDKRNAYQHSIEMLESSFNYLEPFYKGGKYPSNLNYRNYVIISILLASIIVSLFILILMFFDKKAQTPIQLKN